MNEICLIQNSGELQILEQLSEFSKVAVIVDENSLKHCYPQIKEHLPKHYCIQIKSGEEHKNLNTCIEIWQKLTELKFDRKSAVVNLGGGVVGDMGGFCAATYKRGMKFWQIPTTILAQVDASIGGKLGIDFETYKNHIGLFQNPEKVILYPGFVSTLPEREIKSGYAEVIKHALINDSKEWEIISKLNIHEADWFEIIKQSYAVKKHVVEKDPKELGIRKLLNFGHTIGHAVESYLIEDSKRKILHGEAVAMGIVCEAYLSYKKSTLSNDSFQEINNYIQKLYPKVSLSKNEISQLYPIMLQDKKNENEKISFILLKEIGQASYNNYLNWDEIVESIEFYLDQ